MGQVPFSCMKIFPLGVCGARGAPSENLGPPHLSETTRVTKSKFYTHLDGQVLFSCMNFSVSRVQRRSP